MLREDVHIQKVLKAIVDTESEITIIKDSVFDKLYQKLVVMRERTMHGAGRGM